MSPEVEKAKVVATTLHILLCQHKLIKDNLYFDINVFDIIEKNSYTTKAGLEIKNTPPFWEKPKKSISLNTLIKRIIKLTGINIKYQINNNMAPSVCFFSLEDLNKLFDLLFLMSRM